MPEAPDDRDEPDPADSAPATSPREFDVLLTETTDHAAARAIIEALKRAQIAVHESRDRNLARRTVWLRIRSADIEAASQVAGEIFARRNKFKSYPKVQPLPLTPADDPLRRAIYSDIPSFD